MFKNRAVVVRNKTKSACGAKNSIKCRVIRRKDKLKLDHKMVRLNYDLVLDKTKLRLESETESQK